MELPKLVIGDLTLRLPIIQGGMGVAVSKSSLASAVSVLGCLGVVASVGLGEDCPDDLGYSERSCESLRQEIRAVKQQDLPVGVNIMVALTNYRSLVQVCVEENADVIISGAGLPMRLPEYAGNSNVKLVPIVSSARAAEIVCKTWQRKYSRLPDALVVEGPLAGGHLGFKFDDIINGTAQPLEAIVKDVLAFVHSKSDEYGKDIPVIAAGGVYTGKDIARFIKMGASGVQMATRFVATHECDVSDGYKQAYLDATEKDVMVIRSPVGMPARVVNNEFVQRSLKGARQKFSCPYHCLISCKAGTANYCIGNVLLNASRGEFKEGFAMCGHNVYRVDKIVSVKELIDELVADARTV